MTGDKRCKVHDCGRPHYARGFCQAHYRQWRTRGRTGAIRPYRPRREGTVKFSGFRLTPDCVGALTRLAEREELSIGAAIVKVLQEWLDEVNT